MVDPLVQGAFFRQQRGCPSQLVSELERLLGAAPTKGLDVFGAGLEPFTKSGVDCKVLVDPSGSGEPGVFSVGVLFTLVSMLRLLSVRQYDRLTNRIYNNKTCTAN